MQDKRPGKLNYLLPSRLRAFHFVWMNSLLTSFLVLGSAVYGFAAPTISSQTVEINENAPAGTLIAEMTAGNGGNTSTMLLEVGAQEVANWSPLTSDFETVSFSSSFNAAPVIFSQIQSIGDYSIRYSFSSSTTTYTANEYGYETMFRTRQRNSSATGFDVISESQLENTSYITVELTNGSETVGWLAIDNATQGIWSEMPFETSLTDETVTYENTAVSLSGPFTDTPKLLAAVATYNDTDQTGVGLSSISESNVKVYMDEIGYESAHDHAAEAVSLFLIQGSGSLKDINGAVIGEVGSITFSDTDRDAASTVTLLNNYTDPVVFVQPLNEDITDTTFRFTNISGSSFSGYLHDRSEPAYYSEYEYDFELQYFVFEKGSWEIGYQNYSYAITSGNESGAFTIDSDTGEITISDADQLDYESGVVQYNLTIIATDGTGASSSAVTTVNINNVSDSINTDAQTLNGIARNDITGWSVSGAGDVNGDGLDDMIIGAPQDDTNASNAGRAYVAFGNTKGSISDLSDIAAGTGGFVINGESENDHAGYSVSGGGDINGDGLDDLVIGAPFATPNGENSGKIYVVFGKADTLAVELSSIALDSDSGGCNSII